MQCILDILYTMYTAKFLWPQFSGCIYIHSIHHRIMNYLLHIYIYSEHYSSREHFLLIVSFVQCLMTTACVIMYVGKIYMHA